MNSRESLLNAQAVQLLTRIQRKSGKSSLPEAAFESLELPSTERTNIITLCFPQPKGMPKRSFRLQQQPEPPKQPKTSIHSLVSSGVAAALQTHLKTRPLDLDAPGPVGHTPLTIAVKLCSHSTRHIETVKLLLEHGADLSCKDNNGWSLMDEAIFQKNKDLIRLLFDASFASKIAKWAKANALTAGALRSTPDFYLELKWKFTSKFIPLVCHFAPSDTLKILKIGDRFKVDTNLVGWKKLKSKRRSMSLIFLDNAIWVANHAKQVLFDPLEPADEAEKEAVVRDLMGNEPLQGGVSLHSYAIAQATNRKNQPIRENIHNWPCSKYKVSFKTQISIKKKQSAADLGDKSYVKSTEATI